MKKLLLTLIVAVCSICANAITIDDLCGTYTRHIDNVSTGGMGAAMIADAELTITKKDAATLVFSKLFVDEGYPVEGTVDLAAKTITFAPGQAVGNMGGFPQVFANSWGGTKDEEPVVATFDEDGTITLGSEDEAYAGFCVTLPTGMTIFQAQGIITLEKKGITADELCGTYTRHIDNVSTGGMGAAMIADAMLTVTKKDDNTLVFSKLFSEEGFPVEGVLDGKKRTITFAPNQQTGLMGEFPQVLANSWGGTKDDESIVATIDADGNIILGSEDEAYAGFCVTLPTGMTIFQAQGIITLTKSKEILWTADATYQFADGTYVSGTSTLLCCNPEVMGYDYSMEIKTYWGKYDIKLLQNEDGTLSIHNNDDEEPSFTNEAYYWWMNWYDYPEWSEYMCLYTFDEEENASTATIVSGDNGGTIAIAGYYALFAGENEDTLVETIAQEGTFTITWGDGAVGINAIKPAAKADGAIYTLSGQRVDKAGKGLYIRNGRKYLVK